MTHQEQLEQQRRIDVIALSFAVILTIPVAVIASMGIGYVVALVFPSANATDYAALVSFTCLIPLLPVWFVVAFRIRRMLGWPKNAFREVPDD